MSLLQTEAVGLIKAIEETVRQLLFVGIAFGWFNWSDGQTGTVLAAVSALIALVAGMVTRSQVFSKDTVAANYRKK